MLIRPSLGLTANSDIVSLYLEPELGLKVNQGGSATQKNVKETYGLGYNVYAKIGNLNSSVSGTATDDAGTLYDLSGSATSSKYLGFNASTGITWYLPAL